ncbi:MAG: MFS transporter [Casimicrobium sp.]
MNANHTHPAPPRGFVLWLSVAQLISWGTLYYMFSLLLEHFERDLGLTRVNAAIAFSLALLTEGLLAFIVGRLIDHGRARAVMCTGSLLATLGFVALAYVQNAWQLYATWVVIGAAMAGALYQPAFSLLIRRYPDDYRRAIITLTFLGGLASTVFLPLGAWLISAFGWRDSVLILAALHLLICLPIHAYWLRGEPPAPIHTPDAPRARLRDFTRHFPFWGLAAFFMLFLAITSAIGAHLISILREQALSETWVVAIPASIGALQVAGRLVLYYTEKRLDVHWANRWIPALLPAALTVLVVAATSPWLALVFALLYGMANGMLTIVRATAMATYVSRDHAASLNGMLGIPNAVARAAAPSLLAAAWTATGNYQLGLAALCALSLFAVASFWLAQRHALATEKAQAIRA